MVAAGALLLLQLLLATRALSTLLVAAGALCALLLVAASAMCILAVVQRPVYLAGSHRFLAAGSSRGPAYPSLACLDVIWPGHYAH